MLEKSLLKTYDHCFRQTRTGRLVEREMEQKYSTLIPLIRKGNENIRLTYKILQDLMSIDDIKGKRSALESRPGCR